MTENSSAPRPPASARALVFVHVPKTAGSTLKWIIQRHYPADRTIVIEGEGILGQSRAFQALPEDTRRGLLCVAGHVPYGVHDWLPQGARYITMLRDPVAWTLSLRSYIRRMAFFEEHPDYTAFRGVRDLDLDGFVDYLIQANMVDMQTRAISGELPALNFLPPYDPLPADALERALRNLHERFQCVGVVERFDESLIMMKRKLGWSRIHYRRLNVNTDEGRHPELPAATVKRIRACHRSDVPLYEEACRRLSEEVASSGAEFQQELRRFQRANAIYSRLLPIYEASGLARVRLAVRRRFARAQ